jgi:curved DNA-binding protein CbpA
MLACYTVPATYFALKRVFGKKSKATKKKKGGGGGMMSTVFLLLGWCAFFYFLSQASDEASKHFDPYDILGITTASSNVAIKRAYRTLSLKYHPDKNKEEDAQETFDRIARAYQSLTDPASRRNWEKYGHPDGPQSMMTSIGLPAWLMEEENGSALLLVYFIGVCILFPIGVFTIKKAWAGEARLRISEQTSGFFAGNLGKTGAGASDHNIMRLLAVAQEAQPSPPPASAAEAAAEAARAQDVRKALAASSSAATIGPQLLQGMGCPDAPPPAPPSSAEGEGQDAPDPAVIAAAAAAASAMPSSWLLLASLYRNSAEGVGAALAAYSSTSEAAADQAEAIPDTACKLLEAMLKITSNERAMWLGTTFRVVHWFARVRQGVCGGDAADARAWQTEALKRDKVGQAEARGGAHARLRNSLLPGGCQSSLV